MEKNFNGEAVTDECRAILLGVTEMVDDLVDLSEEIAEQIQNTITTEIELYLVS